MTLGEQIRDFSNVVDVAIKIANHVHSIHNSLSKEVLAYNIGSGRSMTVREFSDYWWRHWQATGSINYGYIDYRPNEVMRYLPAL